MDEPYIRFDRGKFKAVVHQFCAIADPALLGNVKLHKALYYADMLHFAAHGQPLTGVDYLKQQFGPVARHLSICLSELEKDGSIRIETEDFYGFAKKRYLSLRPPSARLTNSELALVQTVSDFVTGVSARTISDLSHNIAWETAVMGERIPYASVFGWDVGEITNADRRAAIDDARMIRPSIDGVERARSLQ